MENKNELNRLLIQLLRGTGISIGKISPQDAIKLLEWDDRQKQIKKMYSLQLALANDLSKRSVFLN